MTKLTEAQAELLVRAANASEGFASAADTPKPTISALIKRGMLIALPQPSEPSRLIITEAGRSAIGVAVPPYQSAATATEVAPPPTKPKRKIELVVDLLEQPQGATIAAIMEATGWQAHSVRGAIAGAIKKGLGRAVSSEKTEAGRVYRIVEEAQA